MNAPTARIRARGQLTLPSELLESLRLEEGDLIAFEPTPEGILMRPKKITDATQAWFWTPRWQALEREADKDLKAGRFREFESDEEFLASLTDRGNVEA